MIASLRRTLIISVFRRNLGYKVISVIVAIMLHVVALAQQKTPTLTRDFSVLPEVRNVPENLIVTTPPRRISVMVTGPPDLVRSLSEESPAATIDLSGATPSSHRFPVRYELPENVRGKVEGPDGPDYLTITLERKVRRQFAVEVPPVQAPYGYNFGEPVIDPPQVWLVGPASAVESVRRVVANVDSRPEGGVNEEVTVQAQGTGRQIIENVEIQPLRVRLRIDMRAAPLNTTLLVSPVVEGEVAQGYQLYDLRVQPRMVTVTGPPEILRSLTSLPVSVNVNGLSAPTTRLLTPTPGQGLRLLGTRQIRVTLNVRPVKTAAPPVVASPPQDGETPPAQTPEP